LRIKLRIYAKLFHQRGGVFDYAMRAGPVSANHTAMLSVSARKISLRCFLACRRSTFLLSTLRADQNLFDLIPAQGGFLTLAKKPYDLFAILRK
jgi:1-aminocyclopropane-1-carboxylate deaminase/D-cysteine desulfhydrase-like pyridoxal-dependent ACC family enzyme